MLPFHQLEKEKKRHSVKVQYIDIFVTFFYIFIKSRNSINTRNQNTERESNQTQVNLYLVFTETGEEYAHGVNDPIAIYVLKTRTT